MTAEMVSPNIEQSESRGRLKSGPSPELIQSANQLEIGYAPILYKGLSLADLAHVVMLTEAGVIPRDAAQKLLATLLTVHEIPVEKFVFDPALGDAYKNRERYITGLAPDVGGWLRTGRARREATNIAYQIAVRERVLTLFEALADLAEALMDLAEHHIETVMPDFTYLQHAQPTTLAHYLLAFVFPILRDFERLQACFRRVNMCSGGIGSVNGSRLAVNRKRLAELLGFDGLILHTRDAMWQADMPIEIMADVVAAVINMDRLAEDLQIWVTQEFNLVELADGYCRESVIMPQKKNPYSLAFVRGAAGTLIGQLASMAVVGRTPSGQPDNRIFAYGDVPRSLDLAIQSARLMAGVVRTLSVNTELMAYRAAEGYSQATDLAELIMLEAKIPYQEAHHLVGKVVSTAAGQGIPALRITSQMIDTVAVQTLGRAVNIPQEELSRALQPQEIVATRTGPGGAAPGAVKNMIDEARSSIAAARFWKTQTETHLGEAESNLIELAGRIAGVAF